MNTSRILFSATLLSASLTVSLAGAEPSDGGFDRSLAPVRNAFEIAIGGGYAQNGGDAAAGVDVGDLAGAGGNGELQLGYRISPQLAVGAYATVGGFANGPALADVNDVFTVTGGLKADLHLRPMRSVDPFISLGAGVRYLHIDDDRGTTSTMRGIDLARLQVGVDYRISKGFALAPTIGATATMFVDQRMNDGDYTSIDDKQLSWTITGGLLGRFDI